MKLKYKFIISIIIIMIPLFIGICTKSNAFTQSYDINAINESKYPGVKAKLKAIQSKHPNWKIKLIYTGLNWNDVINGEYSGHGASPRSLTYYTYDGEWVCPICGQKRYDVSGNWYCASKEAIAYMMDPRNSLTEEYLFQFQDLSSTVGDIEAIKLMTKDTFLFKTSNVNAIMRAAKENNVSPFHITSRILLEQGTDGSGIMNGYLYNQIRVYNLFNINVSGNSTQGYENGAKFAFNNQWFTQEASIIGGTKYIKDNYISKGQTTLYFQKFNVIQQNNLYNHQYMQNIRAANDEGYKMYKAYVSKGLLNSEFEFAIPIYENMPSKVSQRPLTSKDSYKGDVNCELQSITLASNSNGKYIYGNIVIVEWINGKSTVPTVNPKITIESTDGSIKQQMYVKHVSGNTYYYDKFIDKLDKSKQYKLYVELAETNNISNNKKGLITLKNQTLGTVDNINVIVNSNTIKYQYEGKLTGNLNKLKLNKTSEGKYYISGEFTATESVNNKTMTLLDIPKVTLNSTDGKASKTAYVKLLSGNKYYFDIYIDSLDKGKKYNIKVESTTKYNISSSKIITLNLSKINSYMGKYGDYIVYIKSDNITFIKGGYIGDINSELKAITLNKNDKGKYYISGEIVVVEWVNGKSTVPKVKPNMRFKSTDGKVNMEVFVTATGTNTYYFDRFIEGIDISKKYVFEVSSGSSSNLSTKKTMNVYFNGKFNNKVLGIYKNDNKIVLENNQIVFKLNTYVGNINSELKAISLNKNNKGKYYISGEIVVVEWVNGKSTVPKEKPKMRFKSTDGKVNMEVFVTATGTNTYYFDRFIEGIDTSKKYVFEVSSGSSLNTSKYKTMNVYFKGKFDGKKLGTYNKKSVILENNKINFK